MRNGMLSRCHKLTCFYLYFSRTRYYYAPISSLLLLSISPSKTSIRVHSFCLFIVFSFFCSLLSLLLLFLFQSPLVHTVCLLIVSLSRTHTRTFSPFLHTFQATSSLTIRNRSQCLPVCLYVRLSVCPCVYLSACLSVCLYVSMHTRWAFYPYAAAVLGVRMTLEM